MDIKLLEQESSSQGGYIYQGNKEIGYFKINYKDDKPVLTNVTIYKPYRNQGLGKESLQELSRIFNYDLYTHKGASSFVIAHIINSNTKDILVEL